MPDQITNDQDEHPAVRRMREQFEAKYGKHAPLASALRAYYTVRKEYDDAWNRDRERPITLDDVHQAERGVFDASDAIARPVEAQNADLAILVSRLARALQKTDPADPLASAAKEFLKRRGLQGSPLRNTDNAVQTEPASE
jgi:hypothetical protein